LFAHDGTPGYAARAAVTVNTVLLPVTSPIATPASTSIDLSWTSPTGSTLTGVMIRRAEGATPPASASAGTRVTDTDNLAASFTDTGLAPGTQYSYAFFAHDGTPVYAASATVTATTVAPGRISGTVTDAGGSHHGLADVQVRVSSSFGTDSTTTAVDGTYLVAGLATADDYTVCFYASGATGGSSDVFGYVDQCYNDVPTYGTPTPVTVTSSTTTPAVNAAMAGGGAISGTVTELAGSQHGLADVDVTVTSPSTGAGAGATTAADGSYMVKGLPAGTDYEVCFNDYTSKATGGSADALGYVDQCYDNQPVSGSLTPVAVTLGASTPGVGAALEAYGGISGTVIDAGGAHHGLGNVQVRVSSESTGTEERAMTDADGSYVVSRLPAASDYEVCFNDYQSLATGGSADALGYVDQCYDNQPVSGSLTSVAVTLGTSTPGIGASLLAYGGISGTVTEAGGAQHGLADVRVQVSSASTGAYGYATTAADGSYLVPRLVAADDFTVCFYSAGATGGSSDAGGYVNQCYNDQLISGTPTPVEVDLGLNRDAIDAALDPK
jgi:hypothetical protein